MNNTTGANVILNYVEQAIDYVFGLGALFLMMVGVVAILGIIGVAYFLLTDGISDK